jgi:hypothetical protein
MTKSPRVVVYLIGIRRFMPICCRDKGDVASDMRSSNQVAVGRKSQIVQQLHSNTFCIPWRWNCTDITYSVVCFVLGTQGKAQGQDDKVVTFVGKTRHVRACRDFSFSSLRGLQEHG